MKLLQIMTFVGPRYLPNFNYHTASQKGAQHYRSFWHEYFWRNWHWMAVQVLTSPKVCFCIT